MEKAIPFGIICLASQQRSDKCWQQARVHLTITVNLHQNVVSVRNSSLVSGHHSTTHPLVFGVIDDMHPGIGALGRDEASGFFWAAIIYHVDGLYFRPDTGNDIENMPADAKTGDDYSNRH